MSETTPGLSRTGYLGTVVEKSKAFSVGDPGKESGAGISPGLECPETVCPCGSDFLPGLWEKVGCPQLTTELCHLGLLPFLSDFRVPKWPSKKRAEAPLAWKVNVRQPREITIPFPLLVCPGDLQLGQLLSTPAHLKGDSLSSQQLGHPRHGFSAGGTIQQGPFCPNPVPVAARADVWAPFLPQGPLTLGFPLRVRDPFGPPTAGLQGLQGSSFSYKKEAVSSSGLFVELRSLCE